jgi:hypothetical protein
LFATTLSHRSFYFAFGSIIYSYSIVHFHVTVAYGISQHHFPTFRVLSTQYGARLCKRSQGARHINSNARVPASIFFPRSFDDKIIRLAPNLSLSVSFQALRMYICHGASVRLDDLVVNVAGDLVVQKRRRPIFERFSNRFDALPAIFKRRN